MPNSLFDQIEQIRESMAKINMAWQPILEDLAFLNKAKAPLAVREILPHKSTPWHLFDPQRPDAFPDAVVQYYSTKWSEAESVFMDDIGKYTISENAKESFKDAIRCHSMKLYRSSILTLLPSLEAESRMALALAPGNGEASLARLRGVIAEAPASIAFSHIAPIRLWEVLEEHLYRKVDRKDVLDALSLHQIPNRHAAIHGLIAYTTELNSLNTLILADYVFYLVSAIKVHVTAARSARGSSSL